MRTFSSALAWGLCGSLASLAGVVWAAPEALPPAPAGSAEAAPAVTAATVPPPPGDPGAALRAYHEALAQLRLDASGALSVEKLRGVTESAEVQLGMGRRDEAIAILSGVVESPRFFALKDLDEGRAAVFTLGDALGRAGAYPMARDYLVRLLGSSPVDTWYRRAVSSLVDFGL